MSIEIMEAPVVSEVVTVVPVKQTRREKLMTPTEKVTPTSITTVEIGDDLVKTRIVANLERETATTTRIMLTLKQYAMAKNMEPKVARKSYNQEYVKAFKTEARAMVTNLQAGGLTPTRLAMTSTVGNMDEPGHLIRGSVSFVHKSSMVKLGKK